MSFNTPEKNHDGMDTWLEDWQEVTDACQMRGRQVMPDRRGSTLQVAAWEVLRAGDLPQQLPQRRGRRADRRAV